MIRESKQKPKIERPPKPDQVIYDGASYSRSDLRSRGIGDETIIQMVASGEVTPCDNAGHGLRYFGDEINAWMKKNRQRVNKRSSDRKSTN
jgi:hypothetical protein